MRLGARAAFVDGELVEGDIDVSGDIVADVGLTPAGRNGVALPGLVDVQVNGFAGVDFASAAPDDYEAAGAALAATGVTAYQPTLITLPEDTYLRALTSVAEAQARFSGPRIIGAHLEGPFLSPSYAGAHDPANMHDPDVEMMDRLLAAGPVTHVTIAPELDGAMELIEHLRRREVIVSCGHSDADAATTNAAFDRGATAVTHLFNAQRPFNHRDPGIAGAALARDSVVVTLIVDGVHLAAEAVQIAAAAAPGRVALITDAIAAAGMPDGTYALADRQVEVHGGAVKLQDGTLAGSVLTMDQALRNLIDLGVGMEDAVGAATTVPARLINRPELGTLRPGTPADVVVVDDDLAVVRTLRGGEELFAAR